MLISSTGGVIWLSWVLCGQLFPCIPAAFLQSHAKGRHAFRPQNQNCTSRLQDSEACLSQIPFALHPFAKCCRVFPGTPACVPVFRTLSPRDPDCLHWPLICQELLMDLQTLYKYKPSFGHLHLGNQDPFRMSQGDWSLGVLLARTLDDIKRHPSNLAISWCSCLSLQIRWNSGSSCIAFLKGVTMLQRQRSYLRWTYQSPNNAATASSLRNGKTQPTQRLGCITGVLTLSFPSAIPLWSSTKQWNCELASRKSQQHRNPSLTKGKQMNCCGFQVAPGGWGSFSKPWHWV